MINTTNSGTTTHPLGRCEHCAAKDAVIGELIKRLAGVPPAATAYLSGGFDPSKCPCNPALGGSGICGCVLGSQITCSVGAGAPGV